MARLDSAQCEIGVIGLDAAGCGVALNLAHHRFNVAACDWEPQPAPTPAQAALAVGREVGLAANPRELLANLRQPRTVFIFTGVGPPAWSLLEETLLELKSGDLLLDAGNSYFKDTARRGQWLAEQGVQYMGLGLAGGQEGPRQGAIVMAGGGDEARLRARPLLEAIATKVHGEPCVSFLETPAAAHFARMVHAGIEHTLLQLLAETFDLMQRASLQADERLDDPAAAWHASVFNGYLMEITGRAFEPVETTMPQPLLDDKLAAARQDAFAEWVARSALELGVSIPTLDAAAGTMTLAAVEREEALIAAPNRQPVGRFGDDTQSVMEQLHGALHAAMIITYAQGLALLAAASIHHGLHFKLDDLVRAWRGCTRLRTALLDDIAAALQTTPSLPDLLFDDDLSEKVMACQECLRHAVWRAHEMGTVVPALLASLDHLDSNRGAWLPVNLIEVPRRPPVQARPLAPAFALRAAAGTPALE